jgi:hypothetical protein
MSGAAEHEAGLAAFLAPPRRARFLGALGRPGARAKLAGELYHFEHRLDEARAERLRQSPNHGTFVEEVLARLVAEGAPERCVVFRAAYGAGAGEPTVADDDAALADAAPELLRQGAGFISCIPGRLGLYVSEDGSRVFLLRGDAAA